MFGVRTELAEQMLFGLEMVVIVYLGAVTVIGETMTLGVLLAFLAYRASFSESATKVIQQVQQWRMIGLHLERLFDIVGEKPEEIGVAPPRPDHLVPAEIRVEELSFAYSPTERPILDRVSFTIPAGGFIAIVGPSGAGKTTLMRLLLGLLTPSSGRILVDGVPLGPATIAAWRQRVGAVLQDDALLSGTLTDNIAFFDPRPDRALIEDSARFARVHHEIMAMPMGYNSLIGDMGSALSSGQRQRLLLARAAYRSPDALFLDEGTANLDELNEAAIGDAIASMQVSRVVIAHWPALIELADTVLTVEGGSVRVCRGDPSESVKIEMAAPLETNRSDPHVTQAEIASHHIARTEPLGSELSRNLRQLIALHDARAKSRSRGEVSTSGIECPAISHPS